MKILIVTPIYPPEIGGPATYVSELQKRLEKNHEVKIIAFSNDSSKSLKENVEIISVNQPFPSSLIRQLKLALVIYRQGKESDIIYAQGPIVTGFVSTWVSKFISKPVFVKFVGDIAWEEAERKGITKKTLEVYLNQKRKKFSILLIQLFQKISFSLASKIVVPSNYLKKILIDYYKVDEKKIKVIFNAVEIPTNFFKTDGNQQDNTLISIGRMVYHKRFDVLIEAFSEFLKNNQAKKQNVRLVLVGDGPMLEKLKTFTKDKNLSKYIKFTGKLDRLKTLSLLKKAKVFILTSEYEGLPHVIIEAMLLEVPVVASNIPGNREVIKNNQNGLLSSPDVNEIAENITKLLDDRKFTDKITKNAKKEAEKKFNWKTHTQQLVHLFRQELTFAKTG